MLEYKDWLDDQIRVYDGLAWADFDRSGKLIKKSNNSFCGILSESQVKEAAEVIKKLPPAPFKGFVYLRFNDLPEGGKSRNYATGETECGVSCYSLTWDLISGCYKRTGYGLDGAMITYVIQGAPAYFLSGEECGTGSDGEPVIKNAKILSSARYDAEKDGYVID